MGQGFSLTTLSAGSAGIEQPELADLTYEKSLGNARFMKTIRARHQDGIVVVKVFVKPYPMSLTSYKRKIIEERKALAEVPNAIAYQRVLEAEENGYLVRQYLYSSLYDRMSTRPFLEDIEKKWLAFQLLCGLRDCHTRNIFHGDIKTENTLVTSWNWLYLSDFSSSFKPTTLPEDNPADFSYYFDTAGRRTCYLAPERFLAAGEKPDVEAQPTWAMDIFSAGCVIAELFLETPIFNLSQMYKYRKMQYDPVTTHLSRIADPDVREMLAHMIRLAPDTRYSAEQYLEFFKKKVFPEYFYSFLHQYMGLITDPSSGRKPISGSFGEADERIDRIYYDFDKISYFLGYEDEKMALSKAVVKVSTGLNPFPVHLNIPNNDHPSSVVGRKPSDDGTLIFLSLIVSSIRNTARATAKIRACDILLAFSERLTDEAKLDRVLPYLIAMLSDESDIVKAAGIRSVTQLMALVTVVSPVNAHVFPEYILHRMQQFVPGVPGAVSEPKPFIRAIYAACLGSLATSASRFLDMVATLRADGSLPTAESEVEDNSADASVVSSFDNSRLYLVQVFGSHTKALITDNDSAVRRAFLGSVPELCMFFGTADSNDIILSHLNTYLNDKDWMLKCAFFETIVGVATFLGGTSLEEFILPLMVQALTDPEESVVRSVLSSLASMAELGLFQRSILWELVHMVGRFTLHPNIWIREAAAMFLSASTVFLSTADIQCIIYPLIRRYLKNPIKAFTELDILSNLKKPIPRAILDHSMTWANKADRGLFWKSAQASRIFSFSSYDFSIPTILTQDLAQSSIQKTSRNEEDEQWLAKLRNMGLSPEDDFKLICLREYIWRVAHSRPSKTTSSKLNDVINLRELKIRPTTIMFDEMRMEHTEQPSSDHNDHSPHTIADALLDASMTIDDTIARRRRSAANTQKTRLSVYPPVATNGRTGHSTVSPSPDGESSPRETEQDSTLDLRRKSSLRPTIPNRQESDDDRSSIRSSSVGSKDMVIRGVRQKNSAINLMSRTETMKSVPETGTTSANVFGRVEGPFPYHLGGQTALLAAEDGEKLPPGTRSKVSHTYDGNDPSILKMLKGMYFDNYPMDVAEFGPMIAPSTRRKTLLKSPNHNPDRSWKPEGGLVATFCEHTGPVHHIAVAPDHLFFLTGGDDGNVKVWDTGRLERNIAHRSRQTHTHARGAKITALCFVELTHTFVSCASDGSINVVKVECGQSTTTTRYSKLKTLRTYHLPEGEMALWADHFKVDGPSTLIVATNRSRVLALDLRPRDSLDVALLYVLENPIHHGTPTCFVVDKKRHWLLLGTSHGVLDLWDLRFRVRLRAWGIPGATAIYRMSLHPTRGRGRWVCVAGGGGQGEVTVWDVEKMQCREVYRAGGSREPLKGYEPWQVDDDKPEGMLGRFATALESSGSSSLDRGVRAMIVGTDSPEDGNGNRDIKNNYGFMITGGSDKRIRFWDIGIGKVENSMVVSGLDVEDPKPVYTAAQPTPSLTLNTERFPRPGPTAPNAGTSSRNTSSSRTTSGRPPRSTVISLQQQQLLKSHLDLILDVALLESPYGMMVSVDRSGVIFVFQ